MRTFAMQVDDGDLAAAKEFFGTVSGAAAVRSAIALAAEIARVSKTGPGPADKIVVKDLNRDEYVHINLAR